MAYFNGLGEEQLHFRQEAAEYVRNLKVVFPVHGRMGVLDFGCGHGFVAAGLAPQVGHVSVWDASPEMRRRARLRLAGQPNAALLDLSVTGGWDGPGFDLILVNSVVQYMGVDEFAGWLRHWRRMLAPGGRIVLSDLIPPGRGSARDLIALLKFSARNGCLGGTVRNVFRERKRYLQARESGPLFQVSRDELSRLAAEAELRASFLARNLTHFTGRLTAVLEAAPERDGVAPAASGTWRSGGHRR
jgi:SAM-dependent methyltransferase